jgi:hypothetical protein
METVCPGNRIYNADTRVTTNRHYYENRGFHPHAWPRQGHPELP